MEEFDDDDDFSDLYADVEVQASLAISAMHGLTGMMSAKGEVFGNAIGQLPRGGAGIVEEDNGFSKIGIAVGGSGSYGNATGVEEGESEDGADVVMSGSVDAKKQKFVDNDDDYVKRGVVFGVENGSKYAGEEIEEGEITVEEGANGKKKHISSGDCYSERKQELTKDSSKSGKKTFDHAISSGDDNMPSLGSSDEGRKKIASGSRGSRRRSSCDSIALDLDKYGTVQIYDSEEDTHIELSDCDSDGVVEVRETSDDMDRRNASSRSNKGFPCSHCPCAAVINGNGVKSRKHSENPTVCSNHTFPELATCDYDTAKGSKSRGVMPNTKDARYYERDEAPKGKGHKHPERPSVSSHKELHEFVSSDYHPFKDSKRHAVESNTTDGRFCKRERDSLKNERKTKRRPNNVSNPKPHLNREDGYDGIGIKGIYGMQSFGYQAGRRDNYQRSEEQNFLIKKRTKVVDNEYLEANWYYKDRRNMAQNVNTLKFEVSRKMVPRYSYAVNGRSTQFSEEGDVLQFRSRGKRLDSPPFYENDSYFIEAKSRRYLLNTERSRDHLHHRYDPKITRDRRKSYRHCNNDTTFESSQRCLEYYHTRDHFAKRKHNQQSALTDPFFMRQCSAVNTSENFPEFHHQESLVRRRYQGRPERLPLNEEDYTSMLQSNLTSYSEGSSYQFERISRRRPDKRYATDNVAEILREREVDRCRYKPLGEWQCGFGQRSKFIHPDSRVHVQPRCQDPCFVHGGEKCTMLSSRRAFETADAIHYGRYGFSNWNNDQEPDKYVHKKFTDRQKSEFLDTEEEQIIDGEISEEPIDCEIDSKHATKAYGNEDIGLDDQKIQEIITKMERRRERFKEPIILNVDSGKLSKQLSGMDIEIAEREVLRPARKRRWLGS